MNDTLQKELILDKVKAMAASAGVADPVISESHLLILQEVTNSKSLYGFELKKNGNEKIIEQKLDRNDVFIVTEIGLHLMKVVNEEFGVAVPQSFPNQVEFAAVAGFTPSDLMAFYKSILSLKVGNTVHIPNMDTLHFYDVPETQKSAAANVSQFNGNKTGFHGLAPQIVFSGADNIDLKVEVPVHNGIEVAAVAANTKNYLQITARGYLIKEANFRQG